MQKKQKKIMFAWQILWMTLLFAQSKSIDFGWVQIQEGPSERVRYRIEEAQLYENVAIDYDTVVHLQSERGTQVYYGPRLDKGDDNVLLLQLVAEDDTSAAGSAIAAEIYFRFKDSLSAPFEISGKDSNVFFLSGGAYGPDKRYSRNEQGSFKIERREKGGFGGSFKIKFEHPIPNKDRSSIPIEIEGEMDYAYEKQLQKKEQLRSEKTKAPGKIFPQMMLAVTGIAILLMVLFKF